MLILAVAAYLAVALLSWGVFIASPQLEDHKATNFVMAMLWPATWLLVAGYLIGQRLK